MSQLEVVQLIMKRQAEAQQRNVLNIWTVYDHPADHPNHYVARRFETDVPTSDAFAGELDTIREAFLRCGLTRIRRSQDDDPVILECWL